jgi:hypothetical protein
MELTNSACANRCIVTFKKARLQKQKAGGLFGNKLFRLRRFAISAL